MEGVWRVYGGCIEGVWRVSGGCVEESHPFPPMDILFPPCIEWALSLIVMAISPKRHFIDWVH